MAPVLVSPRPTGSVARRSVPGHRRTRSFRHSRTARPNPIGLSAVRLRSIDGNILHVGELDILDGTPLLDIKPYIPRYDSFPTATYGWMEFEAARKEVSIADGRFEQEPWTPAE